MNSQELEENLKIGTKIKIGQQYVEKFGCFEIGEVIELIEGYFDEDNGLYCYTSTAPSI